MFHGQSNFIRLQVPQGRSHKQEINKRAASPRFSPLYRIFTRPPIPLGIFQTIPRTAENLSDPLTV